MHASIRIEIPLTWRQSNKNNHNRKYLYVIKIICKYTLWWFVRSSTHTIAYYVFIDHMHRKLCPLAKEGGGVAVGWGTRVRGAKILHWKPERSPIRELVTLANAWLQNAYGTGPTRNRPHQVAISCSSRHNNMRKIRHSKTRIYLSPQSWVK